MSGSRSSAARAEAAFEACAWLDAATTYAAADTEQSLSAAALERWGLAAYLAGREGESDAARERAHYAFLECGDVEAAARVGHWLGVTLVVRGEAARGGGWFTRVQTVLEEHALTGSVWHLFLRVSFAMRMLFDGDAEHAAVQFAQILVDAAAHQDPDLHVLVRNGLGQSLVASGRIEEGLRRLDEVMVMITSAPRISPQVVGLMYCAVIDTCRRCFDNDRAREWTELLSRWCAGQPGLVAYRGQCLVHRAEVLQLHGLWSAARDEVDRVFHQLGEDQTHLAAGMAHYQRGELHRLRGEDEAAEAGYRRAARCGQDPQPGLALLRAAQGRLEAARGSLRRALDEDRPKHDRLRLLPAWVEITLATGDLDGAAAAVQELQAAAADRDVPLLVAASARAWGQVALARGDAAVALASLRAALSGWQKLGAPYDAALTRVDVAVVCRMLGDEETAELELDAARWVFDQLGAAPGLARVDAMTRRLAPQPAPGGLTQREGQILRRVATGATNRVIAGELFLSEKTVARHVANIFLKLGVTSRAAATAFAYEQHLV